MALLTIVVPSRTERFLHQTLLDVLAKARGDIAVYAVLDGYDIPADEIIADSRLTYIRLPAVAYTQKRQAINQVAALATGQYLMSLDAHCMLAEGFDVTLAQDHVAGSVLIPRRHRLDAENWCIQAQSDDRPPIDYERTMWPLKFNPPGLHGFRWDARTWARQHIAIDETMHFQGSCWFMDLAWFRRLGFMRVEGYSGWGQEAEEIGLETWRAGGQVLTDKNTWYAHLHKGPRYGRMYWMSVQSIRHCNAYSFNLWVHERRTFFQAWVQKWWPLPEWPADWEQRLYDLSTKGK
jgi:hypothetical protein